MKSRTHRVEQLRQMYRKGMDVENTVPKESDLEGGEREAVTSGEPEDEVEKLLEWTNTLDEQVLTASPL